MFSIKINNNMHVNAKHASAIFGVLVLISAAPSYVYGQFESVPSPDGTFRAVPRTGFSCLNRPAGYYADVETGCQIYHMCDGLGRQFSYACPNTTLFQQRMLVCDHWYMVNCSKSETNYDANLLIGQRDKPFVGEGELDIRTPRPDLNDQSYQSNYGGINYQKSYKNHNYPAVQNAISPVRIGKPAVSSKDSAFRKDQQTLDSTKINSATPTPHTIRNHQKPPQPTSFIPIIVDPVVKTNDRRNVKDEGNFGSNDHRRNDNGIRSGVNRKPPSILFEPPVNTPIFTANAPETPAAVPSTPSPSPSIPPEQSEPRSINHDSNLQNSNIQKPFADIQPPLSFPIYTTNVKRQQATDSPLKISLSTQSPSEVAPTVRTTATTNENRMRPIDINTELQPPVLVETRIINRPSVSLDNVVIPANDLLPPFKEYKTYDDSTTQGPIIYYEWKEAGPSLELQPPKFDDPALNAKQTPLKVTGNPFTAGTTEEPTSRLFSIDLPEAKAFKDNQPVVTSTEATDYKKLQQQFLIPDFEFPLETGNPGQFEENESVDSFQTKIPAKRRAT